MIYTNITRLSQSRYTELVTRLVVVLIRTCLVIQLSYSMNLLLKEYKGQSHHVILFSPMAKTYKNVNKPQNLNRVLACSQIVFPKGISQIPRYSTHAIYP